MSVDLETDVKKLIHEMGTKARRAGRQLAVIPPGAKNKALLLMADRLVSSTERLQSENAKDLDRAEKSGLSGAMVDRLRLTDARIAAMAQGIREIAALPDPVGEVTEMQTRPNGLRIARMRAPLGVVGMIFESRPNVTADAAALCMKSGNAVILRGGSEAIFSNLAIAEILTAAAAESGIPEGVIQLVPTVDRAAVGEMLTASEFIDVIIPRGGRSLIERVALEARIPVLKHLDGNCTVYVDEFADLESAERIVLNSKTHRTGVCNAAETLLVHAAVAQEFVPQICSKLLEHNVEIRGCDRTRELFADCTAATDEDWSAEYLDLIIAMRIVDSFDDAVEFINHYGSHHTESIVTKDYGRSMEFVRAIDSACVHVNCSTRFSDGFEYGLGAEIGISTDKLHARGPVGLKELTTEKWVVLGEGQIRT